MKRKPKKKIKTDVPSLEYYELVAYGPHIFCTRVLELVAASLLETGFKVGYAGFLGNPIPDIEWLAEELNAKEVPFYRKSTPLGGLHIIQNVLSGSKLESRSRNDVVYEFSNVVGSPVVVGNLNILGADSGKMSPVTATFIVAASEKDALDFVAKFFELRRKMSLGKVVNQVGEPIAAFSKMKWDNVVLPGDMAQRIKSDISSFFGSERIYKDHDLPWRRGILIAGAPGNGKTATCKAIATAADVPVVYCSINDSDVFGVINNFHATIAINAPCIGIIEDADMFVVEESLRGNLLNTLDGLFSCDGVLMVATTSSPDKLDTAFTGRPSRFDSFYVIEDPGTEERLLILQSRIGAELNVPQRELKALVNQMKGFSAASIQEVAVAALVASGGKKITVQALSASVEKVKSHIKDSKRCCSMKDAAGFSPHISSSLSQ